MAKTNPVAYYDKTAKDRLLNNPTKYAEGSSVDIDGTNYTSQGGRLVIPKVKTTPIVPPAPIIATPTPVADVNPYDPKGQAKDLLQGDMQKGADYEKELFGESYSPTTIDEAVQKQVEEQRKQKQFAQRQADLASGIEGSQQQRTEAQATSSIEATKAAMAQSREGAISSGKPLVAQQFEATTNQIIGEAQKRVEMSQNQRNETLRQIDEAQKSNNAKLAETLRGQLAQSEQDIRKAQTDLASAQTQQATAAASIAASQANTQKIQTSTMIDTFAGMGDSAAKLTSTDLVNMASSSGLPYSTVANLQAQAVIQNALAKAKDATEADTLKVKLDTLKAELPTAGQSTNQIDYNYFKGLSSSDQAGFLKYLAAKNPLQVIKDDTTGITYSVDPFTKDLKVAIDPNSITGSMPSTSLDRTIDIKTVGTGAPLPVGTLGNPGQITRADRSNNPTANKAYPVTVQRLIAGGLVKGVDFQVGETTQGIDDDGVATIMYKDPSTGVMGSIIALKSGEIGSWYANPKYGGAGQIISKLSELSGQPVNYNNAQEVFNNLDTLAQTQIVKSIYNHEGGSVLFQSQSSKIDQSALSQVPKELRTAVVGKASQFDGEPSVKNFQTMQTIVNKANAISDTTDNPQDDQALIYAFAKAMDPTSAVREGEYDTIQKYAQSTLDRYKVTAERWIGNSPFLTPEARKNIKKSIQNSFNAEKTSYDQTRSQYIKTLDNMSGKSVGSKLLQDYTTATAESLPEKSGVSSVLDIIDKYTNPVNDIVNKYGL